MAGSAGPVAAQFKFPTTTFTFPITIQADPVSPFALAASWRALKKNLQSHGHMVMSIPDVVIDTKPQQLEKPAAHSLELDLEHYEVPTPDAVAKEKTADLPMDVQQSEAPFYGESRLYRIRGGDTSVSHDAVEESVETVKRSDFKDRCVSVKVSSHGYVTYALTLCQMSHVIG